MKSFSSKIRNSDENYYISPKTDSGTKIVRLPQEAE
jgi:hypothetical protein